MSIDIDFQLFELGFHSGNHYCFSFFRVMWDGSPCGRSIFNIYLRPVYNSTKKRRSLELVEFSMLFINIIDN